MMLFSKALIVLFLVWGTVTVKQFAFFAYQRKPLDSLRIGDKLYNYNACPFALRIAYNYSLENEINNTEINSESKKDYFFNNDYEIYDEAGRKLNHKIEHLNKLPPGFYFIKTKDKANKPLIKKIIIM